MSYTTQICDNELILSCPYMLLVFWWLNKAYLCQTTYPLLLLPRISNLAEGLDAGCKDTIYNNYVTNVREATYHYDTNVREATYHYDTNVREATYHYDTNVRVKQKKYILKTDTIIIFTYSVVLWYKRQSTTCESSNTITTIHQPKGTSS